MLSLVLVCILLTKFCRATLPEAEREDERCEAMVKEIVLEDRNTIVDDTPYRLHSTWLSQECEVRTGPEYMIRKYKFFENGTFLLLRHYYAEESCSVATHTVVARGSIEISSPSVLILGATEAKIELDTVHLIPLNRQVAQKFGRKLNASCGGVEAKWRPYTGQLVYERSRYLSSSLAFPGHGPSYNSLQSHSPLRKRRGPECLESLGIEFTELRLLRVERKRLGAKETGRSPRARVELLLGGISRRADSRESFGPTWLQPTALLRVDTTIGCPICGSVSRGTEYSPPLLHELPPLPALIGGLWLSSRCESVEGGFWSRRLFRIYSGEKRWTARWDYHADSNCSILLYTVTAAGSYVQRAVRRRRDESNIYRHILRDTEASMARSFATMLRGNRKEEVGREAEGSERASEQTIFGTIRSFPSGTTELELRVVESLLIPVDRMISSRCGRRKRGGGEEKTRVALNRWPRNCVPRAVEAPSILTFRARLGLDWSGRYSLLLGTRDDDLWEAPLRRCSEMSSRNGPPEKGYLRDLLRRDPLDPRHGLFSSAASCPNISFLLFSALLFVLSYSPGCFSFESGLRRVNFDLIER